MATDKQAACVLVTGGAGFIGSHLCEQLLEAGYSVQVIDDLSTGRMSNIQHLRTHPQFTFARADINNDLVLDRLASQADIIVHLAAAVGVHLVVEQAAHTIHTNISGTEKVLNVARRYNCRTLLASTSEVYGKGSKIPFAEEDDVVLGATSKSRWGYAASKMVDEFLGLAYAQEHGLDVMALRFFNTVGPRQMGRYGMVIPRFVRQALADEPITVYGDGTQSRCFCHVGDVVQAVMALANTPEAYGRVYNIGNTEEVTIHGLAKRVKALTESHSPIEIIPYEEAYSAGFEDMQRRVPDLTRLQQTIDWQPTQSLDDILLSVIDYEKAHWSAE